MPENHLHKDLPRGTVLKPHGELADAKFEDPLTIGQTPSLRFRDGDGKVLLGLIEGEILEELDAPTGRLMRYATGGLAVGSDDDRHMITVAGSRAGKGVAAIIPNLLRYPGSILAIDPKAELATITAGHRHKGLGQKVHVLDPFLRARGNAIIFRGSFNPMDMLKLSSQTLVEDSGLLADALIVTDNSGREVHWDESAKHFIEGVILHVATAPPFQNEKDRNLVTVYRLIMDLRGNNLEQEMKKNPMCYGAVEDAARNFFEKDEREREGVLSTVRRHIRFLGYQNMRSVLTRSSFDLGDLKKEATTIYLCLPAMRMGTCCRWFRLFVNLVLAQMEAIAAKPRFPVLLCLDEFAILQHMKSIEDAAGQIAGFGVKLWPILQDLGQLKTLYRERWETFMGNAGTLQFFGNSDMTSLEWISKRLGQTTVRKKSEANVTPDVQARTGATGETFSSEAHALLTPEEISRFFPREDPLQRQLVIRTGFNPMILQRVCYFNDPRFQGQFDPPPSAYPE